MLAADHGTNAVVCAEADCSLLLPPSLTAVAAHAAARQQPPCQAGESPADGLCYSSSANRSERNMARAPKGIRAAVELQDNLAKQWALPVVGSSDGGSWLLRPVIGAPDRCYMIANGQFLDCNTSRASIVTLRAFSLS